MPGVLWVALLVAAFVVVFKIVATAVEEPAEVDQ